MGNICNWETKKVKSFRVVEGGGGKKKLEPAGMVEVRVCTTHQYVSEAKPYFALAKVGEVIPQKVMLDYGAPQARTYHSAT